MESPIKNKKLKTNAYAGISTSNRNPAFDIVNLIGYKILIAITSLLSPAAQICVKYSSNDTIIIIATLMRNVCIKKLFAL